MDHPRCFVSFDTAHNENDFNLFRDQVYGRSVPFELAGWSNIPVGGQPARTDDIPELVGQCGFMVVLVGRDMPSAANVALEIAAARDQGIPLFGVYVGSAGTNTLLPEGLARNRVVSWNREIMDRTLAKVISEIKTK